MISNIRKYKHYNTKKLTEVGFCPSVKNQVESFIQAGKVLNGAQSHLYDFKEKDLLDDTIEGESIYNDKIDCLERVNELSDELSSLQRTKLLLKAKQSSSESSEVSKDNVKNSVDKSSESDVK